MKFKRSFASIVIVSILLLATVVYLGQRAQSPLPSATKQAVATTSFVATNKAEPTNPASLPQASATSRNNSRFTPVHLMKELVGLTDEQANKVESIMEKQQKQMAAFRRETSLSRQQRIERLRGMRESDVAQLKSVLTAEQFEKWSKRGLELQKALR